MLSLIFEQANFSLLLLSKDPFLLPLHAYA